MAVINWQRTIVEEKRSEIPAGVIPIATSSLALSVKRAGRENPLKELVRVILSVIRTSRICFPDRYHPRIGSASRPRRREQKNSGLGMECVTNQIGRSFGLIK
jgi:hypothetical protein